ncbi:transcriptional regulator, LacI family [Candidatus Vecturithrix granuli]|uniref:Transcriptional regulator, LacI family n=1 Tax=Vecturithrix granuli TaxID=1499967 RepID=A0A081C260_VECG1|nr:transcriptional regulator, LacI family [Candidatus Vecturithrix granuli]
MSSATLKDIAKEAGVSISTVSLVLSGKKRISQDVRAKVYKVAKQLGYIKPVYGASIATNRLSHLAILVHEDYEKAFEWHFIRQMIINLETVITRDQYYPVIIPVRLDEETNEILEKVVLARVGGLFSIHYGNAELFQHLEEQSIPVVIVNNSNFQNQFYSVCVDDFQGAYEGTQYLLGLGHRRFGYVEYHRPDAPAVLKDRLAGFRTALDAAHIPFTEMDRATVMLFNMEELEQALGKMFEAHSHPTALFVHDDHLAAQVIVTLQRLRIQVPQDVSIIAPGDTLDYNQVFIPRITTMRINTSLLGTLAGEMMLKRLQHDQEDMHVLKVNQTLVERGSCQQVKRA